MRVTRRRVFLDGAAHTATRAQATLAVIIEDDLRADRRGGDFLRRGAWRRHHGGGRLGVRGSADRGCASLVFVCFGCHDDTPYASATAELNTETIPASTGFVVSTVGSVPKRSFPIPLISCIPTPCM